MKTTADRASNPGATMQSDTGPTRREAWRAAAVAWQTAQRSRHTRRVYAGAWRAFLDFCETDPWRTTSDDVNDWIVDMQERGLATGTVLTRLAACASLFDFVACQAPALLTTPRGRLRTNPFRNELVRRPQTRAYATGRPLPDGVVRRMLNLINYDSLTGARDYALLLVFLTTGWRTAAVLGLAWMGLQEHEDAPEDAPVHLWRKGDPDAGPAPLPLVACAAIQHYIQTADRWPLAPGARVWLPIRRDGCANFGLTPRDPQQPISGTQANNVLRKRLRRAGVANSEQYRLSDLRHTFARKYLASGGDARGLGQRLGYSQARVTVRYVAHLTRPVDDQALQEGWV